MSIEKLVYLISLFQILLSNTNLFLIKAINEIFLIIFLFLMVKRYKKEYLIFIFLIIGIMSFELIELVLANDRLIEANQLKILIFIFLSLSINVKKFKLNWFHIFMKINILFIFLSIIGIDLSVLYPLKLFIKEGQFKEFSDQTTLLKIGGLFLNYHVNSFALGLYVLSIIQSRKFLYSLICSILLILYLIFYGTETVIVSFLITALVFYSTKYFDIKYFRDLFILKATFKKVSIIFESFSRNYHLFKYLLLLLILIILFYSSLNFQFLFDSFEKISFNNNSLDVILYQLNEYLENGFKNIPLFPKIHKEYINLKYVNSTEIGFARIFTNYGLFIGTFILYRLISLRWYFLFIFLTLFHYSYFYIPFFLLFIRISNLDLKLSSVEEEKN